MIFAGIDVGSLTAEAVLIEDNRLLAGHSMGVLINPVASAEKVLDAALDRAGIQRSAITYTVSTGYGREKIQELGLAQENVSEISCHGFGAFSDNPTVRTIIDIGGQDAKVIKIDDQGQLLDFAMNDKCAAGTGHFLEVMSRALEVPLEELGPLSQRARKPIEMSTRCSIYVETEVLHYLQRGIEKADLALSINRAMAERVMSLVRRVKPEKQIVLTGGVAKNTAVRSELERILKTRLVVPKVDPQWMGAYGAAMLAARNGGAR